MNTAMLKRLLKALVPSSLISVYHLLLAEVGSVLYGFPSRKLLVIGVTGTKGKSSTTEMIQAIFEAAGKKTALLNSIRIKVADQSEPNTSRMSMPGRFFIQRFLARAVREKCDVAILEMTSEGARQHRHHGVALDALVFTNLAPEHIESHGSYEAYADAKFSLGRALARSPKRPRVMVAHEDDPESSRYLELPVEVALPFSLSRQEPWEASERGGSFTFGGRRMDIALSGEFSLKNALAAASVSRAFGVPLEKIAQGLLHLTRIPGRAERIEEGQNFTVVVDYAHTPDSLKALYEAYPSRKICVLGATGGGRDAWKRPVMGKMAETYCDHIVLTDEDPYDEDPEKIVHEVASGMEKTPEVVMDRRAAIARGLSLAQPGDAVLITGKGTDPCICGPRGEKLPWSDAAVAREELKKIMRGVTV
jgi:UDP-N-acetylmuramoyl-L-alanyl-D-glutamate--2,6-diaminopimelate ligase